MGIGNLSQSEVTCTNGVVIARGEGAWTFAVGVISPPFPPPPLSFIAVCLCRRPVGIAHGKLSKRFFATIIFCVTCLNLRSLLPQLFCSSGIPAWVDGRPGLNPLVSLAGTKKIIKNHFVTSLPLVGYNSSYIVPLVIQRAEGTLHSAICRSTTTIPTVCSTTTADVLISIVSYYARTW